MVTFTVKVTRPASNKLLKAVSIDVAGTTNAQKTPSFGDDDTSLSQEFQLEPGDNYTITVTGPGYLRTQAQNVTVSDAGETTIALKSVWFSLHTDRDRDGKIENGDDTPAAINGLSPAAITFGVDGVGAIIPVNCNRDGNNTDTGYGDNQDDKVNSAEDLLSGFSRLKIIRHTNGVDADVDPNWVIKLSVQKGKPAEDDANRHVRILSEVATGATELISPQKGNTITLNAANIAPNLILPLEMLRFAGKGFESGTIKIMLSVIQPEWAGDPTPSYAFTEQVIAAKWIANHHLHPVKTLLVANDEYNGAFVKALKEAVNKEPTTPDDKSYPILYSQQKESRVPYLDPITNDWVLTNRLGGINLNMDKWLRDTVFSGYSSWPGSNGTPISQTTFIKMHRERKLQNWVYRTLHSKDHAVYYPAAGSNDPVRSANSGGNFEVTPPVKKTNGSTYPLGRIYYGNGGSKYVPPMYRQTNAELRDDYGHTIDSSTKEFLSSQTWQNPIELNTDWLKVGHVDEMMTFLPYPGGGEYKKWKLLVASPKKAYELMDAIKASNGGATLLAKRNWNGMHNRFDYETLQLHRTNVKSTIAKFFSEDYFPLPNPRGGNFKYNHLKRWNLEGVQQVIDDNISLLADQFDLDRDADIIHVPVIFVPEKDLVPRPGGYRTRRIDRISSHINSDWHGFNVYPGRYNGFQCGALTADMPNMFVGNTQLYIPKPYGPWIQTGNDAGYDLFEKYLEDEIKKFNVDLNCNFIDDWDDYHACSGEIHCGTNEIRKAPAPDLKWWAFKP